MLFSVHANIFYGMVVKMMCPAGKCECVHYSDSQHYDFFCAAFGETRKMVIQDKAERCPAPSKIKAPEKDPIQECIKEMALNTGKPELIEWDTEIYPILKKHWPKKGDVDNAWKNYALMSDILPNRGPHFKSEFEAFKKALKAGGFL